MQSRPKRSRHFNFHCKSLDSIQVETPNGPFEFVIPAIHRSCYWAILRYMYLHPNRPVPANELCAGVQRIMTDTDPMKWSRFEGKESVFTVINGETVRKPAQQWKNRLLKNARNLCRLRGNGAYGRRLIDLGHVLRYETKNALLYFTLSTTLTPERIALRKWGRRRGTIQVHRRLSVRCPKTND
jgi:hypothetical protein